MPRYDKSIIHTEPPGAWASHPDRACIRPGINPDMFFVDQGGAHLAALAIAVCRRCPVLDPCRAYAIRQPQLHGVWGGTAANERERLRSLTAAKEEFFNARSGAPLALVEADIAGGCTGTYHADGHEPKRQCHTETSSPTRRDGAA